MINPLGCPQIKGGGEEEGRNGGRKGVREGREEMSEEPPISTGYVSAALCLRHASGADRFYFSLCSVKPWTWTLGLQ